MPPKNSKNYNEPFAGFEAACPLCDARFNPFAARIIDNKEDVHLLHTQCPHCGAYIVSLISNTPFGLSSVGIITDLTAADVLRFKDEKKIDFDDVLAIHRAICENKVS